MTPDGPGAQAGLKPGDIVISSAGEPIRNAAARRNEIAASAPGTEIALKVWRDGKEITKKVKLGELPASSQGAFGGEPTGKRAEPRWGLQLSDVPSAMKQNADSGALVTAIQPGSPADDADMRPGDVIVDVQGDQVATASQAQKLLQSAKSPVRIRVLRDGRGLFLVLTTKQDD